MVYGGIDYSINCPCICIYDDSKGNFSHSTSEYYFYQHNVSKKEQERWETLNLENIHPVAQMEWNDNTSRYLALADFFLSILLQYDVKIVAMEDYAMGANGRVFNIAECTGYLKQMMMLVGIEFHPFAPTLVKRVFSGKGNADKEFMVKTYGMRYSQSIPDIFGKHGYFESPVSDIVDSHAMLFTYFKEKERNDEDQIS